MKTAIQQLLQIRQLRNNRKISSTDIIIGWALHALYFVMLPKIIRIFWNQIISTFSNKQIYFGSMMTINLTSFWFFCFALMILQMKNFTWLQKLKITSKKWLWDQDYQKWKQLLTKTLKILVFHGIIINSVLMYFILLQPLPYDFSLDKWPSTLNMLLQILFFILVQDFLFYFSHRLLHHPKLYWIHKSHHQYHQTVSVAAQYAHTLQFFFSGLIPTTAGILILNNFTSVHFITIFIWVFLRTIQGCINHSGYYLPFQTSNLIPGMIGPDHHDFHHAANTGNYGSFFMFWDAICGTQKQYVKWLRINLAQNKETVKDD